MVAWQTKPDRVAILSSARTPLVKAGAALAQTPMTELARTVLIETLYRAGFPGARLDEVILGNVSMPPDAPNPARVAALEAGIPLHVPAYTVQRNCGSGMEAVAQAATHIQDGAAQIILAGGAESMSTIPLLFPSETLEPMAKIMRARGPLAKLSAIASLRPRHFKPISGLMLGLTDPVAGMIMGKTAEILAHEFHISRETQDAFALRSHQRAVAAVKAGRFDEDIAPVYAGADFKPVTKDIGPRAEQTMEALAKLKPIFDRKDGSVTVGNACQVTDGAAAMLVANADMARGEGMTIHGYIRGYATAGLDPQRMGLGPVYAIDHLLHMTGMSLSDIGLIEINEAFAAQVLACTTALASDHFAQQHLGRAKAIGEVDPDRLNVNGGAIALGHPVGATGARIVQNLVSEMSRRDVQFGIASLCIGGGQGAAMLLERR
ncbi:MAG: acetyl-CoA C-acyltransferase [Planctomycetes bacterium]|nr:acetyl-CoA C-acyltransferase [Planctomycetota bacterium]